MRTVNHCSKRMLAILLVCVLCINLCLSAGFLQKASAEEVAASGVDLMDSASFGGKAGVLSYDVDKKEGWIGGNGTTASTDMPARYFTYNTFGGVIVDGKEVTLASREITYSVTFSNFTYDTTTYPNGVRQQGVSLMLQYNDGTKDWILENRFGGQMYGSGQYMQVGSSGSTLLEANAGAPFYSESVKNSVAKFPALANGDTISLKVKCATETENGYIKLLLNGEEKHSFVYTGTKLPDFGLKSYKLMAKISNISLYVDGASGWAENSCACEEPAIEKQVTAPTCGEPGYTTYTCTLCGTSYIDDLVAPLGHTCEDGVCTVCGAKEWDTDGDGVLEILALGNSFSVDALEYVWQIANDLGIEKIVLGNLNIGGCSLQTHAANAAGDLGNYNYRYSENGKWTSTDGYKISTALESRSWDYVSLQQQSGNSGMIDTYDDSLTNLVKYIKERSYAKMIWHMTWAYQQDSTNESFAKYGKDQMTMYNAIVSAVQSKIVPNSDFDLIVPNGTAVQNSRTSILGDTTTRDGYHMSTGYGRYLTGLMFFKQVTGMSIDGITYAPAGVSGLEKSFAIESVNNAYAKPFEITQSAVQHEAGTAVKENESPATCTTPSCYDMVVYCTKCGVEMSRETVVTAPALGHKYSDHVCTVCGKDEGVDLMSSATFDSEDGVLFYDVNRGQGWIGGDGTTASTDMLARYFTYNTFGDVIVDGEAVALTSREVTYSVTFSDFVYDTVTYPNGVRQQGVILMLRYNDGAKTWTLENRFGDLKYQSGHYMQINGSNSTLLDENAGAPFYSESRKNSIANFPVLTKGDIVSLKVKCATETENGYIKLLINDEEKHSFIYTGTRLPDFGLKSCLLMAKISDVSLIVDGATVWAPCTEHTPDGQWITDKEATFTESGSRHQNCSVCGEVAMTEEIPCLAGDVESWNLTLSDDLAVNFRLNVNEAIAETAVIVVAVAGDIREYPVASLVAQADGTYLVTAHVAAAQMNDTITVKIVDGENESVTKEYTVAQYAKAILANDSYSAYHALVKEMLNYGNSAQTYFGYNVENRIDVDLTGTGAAEVAADAAPEMVVSGNVDGISFYGASLVLRNKIAVRYYFTVTGDVNSYTFTVNGTEYEPVLKDNLYYIEVADINPQDLDDSITVMVNNTLSVSYSPMNYIVRMSTKGSDNLKALMKALYNYHLAAEAYTA